MDDLPVRRISSDRFTTGLTAWMDGSRWRSRRCWRTTPEDTRGGQRPPGDGPDGQTCSSRSPERRRASCHRRGDLCRSADQCHTPLLPRAVPGGGRRVSPRHRAAHRDGTQPSVPSVASLFVSRWDVAVAEKVPAQLHNQLGIAMAKRTYKAYRELLGSDRWLRSLNDGARRNGCSGPVRAPKIPWRRMSCTSSRSLRHIP